MFSNIDYSKTVITFEFVCLIRGLIYDYGICYKTVVVPLSGKDDFVIKNLPFNLKSHVKVRVWGFKRFYNKSKKIPYGCICMYPVNKITNASIFLD